MPSSPEELYYAKLIRAAQDYDLKYRQGYWTRVPDDQVLRLLTGAEQARRETARDVPSG